MSADSSKKRKVKVIETKQGSDDWKKKRKGLVGDQKVQFKAVIGSSTFGAAAGLDEYKSPLLAYLELIGENDFKGNDATNHGNQFESVCADFCSQRIGERLYEMGILKPSSKNPLLGSAADNVRVSPDRWGCTGCATQDDEQVEDHLSHEGFFLVECKCPYGRTSYQNSYQKRMKQSHHCQLAVQMAVSQTNWIYYAVALVDNNGKFQEGVIRKVHFSDDYWNFVFSRTLQIIELATNTLCLGERYEDYIRNELPDIEDINTIPTIQVEQIFPSMK